MTGRTHDIIGLAALLTATVVAQPTDLTLATMAACLVGVTIGSLSPDLDQATNRLWGMIPAGGLIGRFAKRLLLGHRSLSHSIAGSYLYYKALWVIVPAVFNTATINTALVVNSVMIGFISHLAADALTKDGIPLLFPIKIKFGFPPLSALRITTGKWIEKIILFPSAVVYIVWLVSDKRDIIIATIRSVK